MLPGLLAEGPTISLLSFTFLGGSCCCRSLCRDSILVHLVRADNCILLNWRVYFPSYVFRSIKPKTQKCLAAIYLYLLYCAFYLSFKSISIRSYFCKWPWRDWQPLFCIVCKCSLVCVGAYIGDLLVPPTGLIPWFLTKEILILTFLHHPFLFKGKIIASLRSSRKNF